jgi:S1-C subfamily serine protease
VNTSIASRGAGNIGIGVAIAVDSADNAAQQIIGRAWRHPCPR